MACGEWDNVQKPKLKWLVGWFAEVIDLWDTFAATENFIFNVTWGDMFENL